MKHPNLVYVFPDQMRQRALGFRGEDPVYTPNLDAFAAKSLEMRQMISNFPVCSPYRAMLMTGKYPMETGVYTNCHSGSADVGNYLKAGEVCLSDLLVQNGYDAGYIGKWHLDPGDKGQLPFVGPMAGKWLWDAYTAPERRHSFRFWYSYGCDNEHLHPHYWVNEAPIEARVDVDQWSAEHETDVACRYILNAGGTERPEDRPFCLFVSMNPPHMPFTQVPEKYLAPYRDKTDEELLNAPNAFETPEALASVRFYFAAVTGVDEQFGRILAALDEKGIAQDTIVVFTSDHGEMMGSHALCSIKDYWFRESVRVPFLVRYPRMALAGACDQVMNVVDILPTLLDLMGLSGAIPADVQGESLAAAMKTLSRDDDRYALYGSTRYRARGLIGTQYTYARQRFQGGMREFLYDNVRDPHQQCNLASLRPELAERFRNRLIERCHALKDAWNERDDGFGRR